MMRWLSYLLITLRQLIGKAGGSSEFTEWKLGFLLLLMETIVAISIVYAAFERVLDVVNRYVLLLAIVLPLLAVNRPLLAASNSSKYTKELARLPRLQRILLNIAAVALVAVTFVMPFVVRTLKTGQPWWE